MTSPSPAPEPRPLPSKASLLADLRATATRDAADRMRRALRLGPREPA